MGCNQERKRKRKRKEKKRKEKKKITGFLVLKEIQIKCANTRGVGIHAIICVCSRGNDYLSQEIVTTIVLFLPIGISDTLLIGH